MVEVTPIFDEEQGETILILITIRIIIMMHHDVAPVFDEGQGDHHDSTAHYAAKKLRFCLTFLKKLHLIN